MISGRAWVRLFTSNRPFSALKADRKRTQELLIEQPLDVRVNGGVRGVSARAYALLLVTRSKRPLARDRLACGSCIVCCAVARLSPESMIGRTLSSLSERIAAAAVSRRVRDRDDGSGPHRRAGTVGAVRAISREQVTPT